MKANSTWSWLKRWGLWILAGLAAVLFLVIKLLPKPKSKESILRKAHEEAENTKSEAKKRLEEHRAKMQEREDELKEIEVIEDEDERLRRLADFANRGSP